jgi:hypothetical protein
MVSSLFPSGNFQVSFSEMNSLSKTVLDVPGPNVFSLLGQKVRERDSGFFADVSKFGCKNLRPIWLCQSHYRRIITLPEDTIFWQSAVCFCDVY